MSYICAFCKQEIVNPDHAVVTWRTKYKDGQCFKYDIQIVHHYIHSPNKDCRKQGCYPDNMESDEKLLVALNNPELGNLIPRD